MNLREILCGDLSRLKRLRLGTSGNQQSNEPSGSGGVQTGILVAAVVAGVVVVSAVTVVVAVESAGVVVVVAVTVVVVVVVVDLKVKTYRRRR
jgi:Flp pilus assembly protein TadB